MDRATIMRHARIANKQGIPYVAKSVTHQLMEFAGDRIGLARCEYSSDFEPLICDLNGFRDEFVAKVDEILERRVDRAYMLSREQRGAVDVFRGFRDVAAQEDWSTQEGFSVVSEKYDEMQAGIMRILQETANRVLYLQTRRWALTHKEEVV